MRSLLCSSTPPTRSYEIHSPDDATTEMPSQVYYLQSQNGNMYDSQFFEDGSGRTEYSPLRQDVPSEVPWCSEALGIATLSNEAMDALTLTTGKHPDAVNVWIGDSRSVTSIHSGKLILNHPYRLILIESVA